MRPDFPPPAVESVDTLVIGAGPAGLSAAYRLQTLGRSVAVLDSSPDLGGHVRTLRRAGWVHEWGPQTVPGTASELLDLAQELGLSVVEAGPAARERWLWIDGRLQRLPTNPLGWLISPLLPWGTLPRLVWGALRPRPPRDDETLASFFGARLGERLTRTLVDAVVSGIYGGDIDQLGVATALPRLWNRVRHHGSLLRALLSMGKPAERERPENVTTSLSSTSTSATAATSTTRRILSLAGGLGRLTEALGDKLGSAVRLGVDTTVTRTADGRWQAGGVTSKHLILAVPAHAIGRVMGQVDPEWGALADRLPFVSMTLVHLRLARRPPIHAFGFLVPRGQGLRLLGALFPSALFDRGGADVHTATVFYGGAHDPQAATLSDTELTALARAELTLALGRDPEPVDVSVVRIPQAIPQSAPWHGAWVSAMKARAVQCGGVWLIGNAYAGVSVGDTVADALATATRLAAMSTAVSTTNSVTEVSRASSTIAATAQVMRTSEGGSTECA